MKGNRLCSITIYSIPFKSPSSHLSSLIYHAIPISLICPPLLEHSQLGMQLCSPAIVSSHESDLSLCLPLCLYTKAIRLFHDTIFDFHLICILLFIYLSPYSPILFVSCAICTVSSPDSPACPAPISSPVSLTRVTHLQPSTAPNTQPHPPRPPPTPECSVSSLGVHALWSVCTVLIVEHVRSKSFVLAVFLRG